MKKFICPICDQSDIAKENDLFVCQGCGTKYHAEEVRKNFAESNNISDSQNISSETSAVFAAQETILARSTNAITKINSWEKNKRLNAALNLIAPAIFFCMPMFYALIEDIKISELFEDYPFLSTFSFACAIVFFVMFFLFDKNNKKNFAIAEKARNTASKESIVVTNTRIFGSTNTQSFSIPVSEIKNTYIERKLGKSSTVISGEVLCVICEKETLCFEFFENNSEISNAIKTALPQKSDYKTTDNITKKQYS